MRYALCMCCAWLCFASVKHRRASTMRNIFYLKQHYVISSYLCLRGVVVVQMWTFDVSESRRLRETDRPPLIGLQPHLKPIIPHARPSDTSSASTPDIDQSTDIHPHSYEGNCFPISFPRLLAARTILFNDGGLHVSPCGRFMVVTLAARPLFSMQSDGTPSPSPPPSAANQAMSLLNMQTRPPPIRSPLPPSTQSPPFDTARVEATRVPARMPRLPAQSRFKMVTQSSYSSAVSRPIRFGSGSSSPFTRSPPKVRYVFTLVWTLPYAV